MMATPRRSRGIELAEYLIGPGTRYGQKKPSPLNKPKVRQNI